MLEGTDSLLHANNVSLSSFKTYLEFMRESNRNLDIPPPPPGIPGEFACLVFEEGGNLTFFSSGRWGICLGVGNLNFSFKVARYTFDVNV